MKRFLRINVYVSSQKEKDEIAKAAAAEKRSVSSYLLWLHGKHKQEKDGVGFGG